MRERGSLLRETVSLGVSVIPPWRRSTRTAVAVRRQSFAADEDATTIDREFTDESTGVDPESSTDDAKRLSQVWSSSDNLRRLLRNRGNPGPQERHQLKSALVYQLNTLALYWQVGLFERRLQARTAPSTTISLYVILFPGEARDSTGIKDLNDNVIGYWWSAEFIRRRQAAIGTLFGSPGTKYMVAAQTYKTALLVTYEQNREDFAKRLAALDEQLRVILLDILVSAEKDADDQKRKEIKTLRKKLQKKGYRFDLYFGLRTLAPTQSSSLDNTYLLVTEALKAAGVARITAKLQAVKTKPAQAFKKGIDFDTAKLDRRGKEFLWTHYARVSDLGEKVKALCVQGYTRATPYVLDWIYVDTVWTRTFVERKLLHWGNPDVVRDVRKKKLKAPAGASGSVSLALGVQKELLELWLTVLNLLDFVKRFKLPEFRTDVQKYHDDALKVFKQIDTAQGSIDWMTLERVLTHDVRQVRPVAVFQEASEFQFYSKASDFSQRMFFSMDVRDLGVELMLHYEHSNREVGYHKYSDRDLMNETFRASDAIDERRRVTYERVVQVFKRYYDQLRQPANAKFAATATQQAMGDAASEPLGSFEDSAQIMLGGDEVFVAAHPLYAGYACSIIADLDRSPLDADRTLDLRVAVTYSSALKSGVPVPREAVQLSHQEGMKLADEATGLLKPLERTQRRIERLIDLIEANPKKRARAAGYRNELGRLRLGQLYVRVKHGKPKRLTPVEFRNVLLAIRRGGIVGAMKTKLVQLVDFNCTVVDGDALVKQAAALEGTVRRDVGVDNQRIDPPSVIELPAWIRKLLDKWADQGKQSPTIASKTAGGNARATNRTT